MQISVMEPEAAEGATDMRDDSQWSELSSLLMSLVTRWVYAAHVISWYGQENDVAIDITYTAIKKTLEYMQYAQENRIVVVSLKRLAIVIAKNHFQDTRRRDFRLLRGEVADYAIVELSDSRIEDDLEDMVLNKIFEESLFQQVAGLVVQFSPKLKRAVLTDIALRIDAHGDFHCHPTALRQAFAEAGIRLEEYLPPEPDSPVLRSRRASLVSLAYKRIAKSICL